MNEAVRLSQVGNYLEKSEGAVKITTKSGVVKEIPNPKDFSACFKNTGIFVSNEFLLLGDGIELIERLDNGSRAGAKGSKEKDTELKPKSKE